jgi:hypothetical protein
MNIIINGIKQPIIYKPQKSLVILIFYTKHKQ